MIDRNSTMNRLSLVNRLSLDDCCHCACCTDLAGYTREQAVEELERGILGCANCLEDEADDKHFACVILYEDDIPVWDGRCSK